MTEKRLSPIETVALSLILTPIPPLVGFLTGWWIAVPLLPERWVWLPALIGMLTGFVIDAVQLRRWVTRASTLPWRLWVAIYGFYAVGVYGFFMGVPLFNAGLALPAGVVVGLRLARAGADVVALRRGIRRTRAFTTGVLALFCVASAILALGDGHTAANLEGMLRLPFEVTSAMIIGLIVVGGVALLAFEWWFTTLVARWAYGRAGVAALASAR